MDALEYLQHLLEDAGWEESNPDKIKARLHGDAGAAWTDSEHGYRIIVEAKG